MAPHTLVPGTFHTALWHFFCAGNCSATFQCSTPGSFCTFCHLHIAWCTAGNASQSDGGFDCCPALSDLGQEGQGQGWGWWWVHLCLCPGQPKKCSNTHETACCSVSSAWFLGMETHFLHTFHIVYRCWIGLGWWDRWKVFSTIFCSASKWHSKTSSDQPNLHHPWTGCNQSCKVACKWALLSFCFFCQCLWKKKKVQDVFLLIKVFFL